MTRDTCFIIYIPFIIEKSTWLTVFELQSQQSWVNCDTDHTPEVAPRLVVVVWCTPSWSVIACLWIPRPHMLRHATPASMGKALLPELCGKLCQTLELLVLPWVTDFSSKRLDPKKELLSSLSQTQSWKTWWNQASMQVSTEKILEGQTPGIIFLILFDY